ncbi:MAG: HAMP domain-containing sensor histidine kinase [bacterium]|nr:HAMP domain-containing sensor histidine kinase [bacterium]
MAETNYEAELKAATEAVYKHSLELARLKQELEVTNERQEGLLHFIGHEVKGFLTKDMAAFATLLEGDVCTLPDGAKPFIDNALAQTREGVRSVTELLEASNQKKGTVTYKKESFDLKELVADVTEKLKPTAEEKGLSLALNIAEGEYMVMGDREKFGGHVLRNLIDNAINYTPHGSIEVSLKKEANKAIFAVKDTGVGVSDEDKKRLFTEGGKGKESQKINVHSTGYGLYIAKSIVEAHGGAISASSDGPGKGSTFIVELPA